MEIHLTVTALKIRQPYAAKSLAEWGLTYLRASYYLLID